MNDYFYKTKNTEKDNEKGTKNFEKYYIHVREQVKEIMKKERGNGI